MALLLLSILWLLTVAGLLARAIGQYRHFQIIRASEEKMSPPPPQVVVIVPARNEAENIRRCLEGLIRQDYPRQSLRLFVVDDNSEDQTAAIVREVARLDDRIELIAGGVLPAGWAGKPFACWQAAAAAEGADWLCFLDADVAARPPLIRTALQTAIHRRLDLLSLQPFQELGTFWERIILPAAFFLLAFTQDLRRTNDPSAPDAAVDGQFLLARRAAYDAIGGHEAVRGSVAEDSALAQTFKRGGFRIAMLGSEGLLSTRMYRSLGPLWDGAARQAGQLLPSRLALTCAAAAAVVLAAAPVALLAWSIHSIIVAAGAVAYISLAVGLAGSLSLLGTHVGAARYFRVPFWYGLLFPLGYLLGAGILIHAAGQCSRRRVRWKGRDLPVSRPQRSAQAEGAGEQRQLPQRA